MAGSGTPLVRFFAVDVCTDQYPVTIQKVWVRNQNGAEFTAWRMGKMTHAFYMHDEKVRIENHAIHTFHIYAPYDNEPGEVVSIHVKSFGKEKVTHLRSPWHRLLSSFGFGANA